MSSDNFLLLEKMITSIETIIDRVVFVGGVTTFLYLNVDDADIRATIDVDVIINANLRQLQKTESELLKLGFQPDQELRCRHKKEDLILDLMPIDPSILGFTNRWYQKGIETAIRKDIGKYSIKILSLEYFFATKIEAFLGRGKNDFYGSKDIEDIIAVLAGRTGAIEELQSKTDTVIDYIKKHFGNWLKDECFKQSVRGNFPANSKISPAQLLTDISSFVSA